MFGTMYRAETFADAENRGEGIVRVDSTAAGRRETTEAYLDSVSRKEAEPETFLIPSGAFFRKQSVCERWYGTLFPEDSSVRLFSGHAYRSGNSGYKTAECLKRTCLWYSKTASGGKKDFRGASLDYDPLKEILMANMVVSVYDAEDEVVRMFVSPVLKGEEQPCRSYAELLCRIAFRDVCANAAGYLPVSPVVDFLDNLRLISTILEGRPEADPADLSRFRYKRAADSGALYTAAAGTGERTRITAASAVRRVSQYVSRIQEELAGISARSVWASPLAYHIYNTDAVTSPETVKVLTDIYSLYGCGHHILLDYDRWAGTPAAACFEAMKETGNSGNLCDMPRIITDGLFSVRDAILGPGDDEYMNTIILDMEQLGGSIQRKSDFTSRDKDKEEYETGISLDEDDDDKEIEETIKKLGKLRE